MIGVSVIRRRTHATSNTRQMDGVNVSSFEAVCIAHHSLLPQAAELAELIVDRYRDRCRWWSANEGTLAREEADDRLRDTDLIITVGGDGTILRGMHAASLHGIPVLGVNMGRVGFMSEIDSRDALEEIEWYLEGNGRIDERAMLKATLSGENGEILHALNDVTVHRGAELRIIEVKAVYRRCRAIYLPRRWIDRRNFNRIDRLYVATRRSGD